MQTIQISEKAHQQAKAFATVYRTVTGEDADLSTCIQLLLDAASRQLSATSFRVKMLPSWWNRFNR